VKFTANFYSRMLGAIVLAYAGYSFGVANSSASPSQLEVWATSLLTLCGAALGLVLTPYLTIDPLERALKRARTMTFPEIVGNTVGVMVGLLAGVMAAAPLGRLPGVLGEVLPSMAAIIFAHLGYRVARNRKQDFQSLFRSTRRNPTQGRRNRRTLVDTSIIIDGRIIDVIKTGFVTETLLVPRFVLREIQRLADSGDEMTRSKGKRGLDTLRVLQESPHVEIKISEEEFAGIRDVDDKLVALARAENVPTGSR
jgi:uncharacterized protein YacL